MKEQNPISTVLETLGQKIIDLSSELDIERMYRRSAEDKVKTLEAENAELRTKLGSVNAYIREMEGAENEQF